MLVEGMFLLFMLFRDTSRTIAFADGSWAQVDDPKKNIACNRNDMK